MEVLSSWILLLHICLTKRFLPSGVFIFQNLIRFSHLFYLFNLTMYSWVTSFDRLASNKRTKQFWVPNFAYNSSMSSSPIPVDLFVSKKHPGLTGGDLGFADASGNVTFRLNRHSSPKNKRLFLDSTGNPLISIYRCRVSLSLLVLRLICNAHQLFETMSKPTCFYFPFLLIS